MKYFIILMVLGGGSLEGNAAQSVEWHIDMIEAGHEQLNASQILKDQIVPLDGDFDIPMKKSTTKCSLIHYGNDRTHRLLKCTSFSINLNCQRLLKESDRVSLSIDIPGGRAYMLRVWCKTELLKN